MLQQAFAVDIPHPREARRSFFVQNQRNIMTDLYHEMTDCSVCYSGVVVLQTGKSGEVPTSMDWIDCVDVYIREEKEKRCIVVRLL